MSILNNLISGIYDLTPVEKVGASWFKREDKFAPLGYGDVNGAKLRQCIYLIDKWVKAGRIVGVVSGAVANSPQHAFVSSVCRQYRLGCLIVTAKKEPTGSKYLEMAHANGAKFYQAKVGYAKTLNSISKRLASKIPNHAVLETNITLEQGQNSAAEIEKFHSVGAFQAQNIPDHISTLVIPCGSCNSVTSILYGVIKHKPKGLKKIVLLGIGNLGSKDILFVKRRLELITREVGVSGTELFDWSFNGDGSRKYQMEHHDLNGQGFCRYEDEMQERIGEIEFHPRYEGKCIRFMKQTLPHLFTDSTMFWIIGSDIKKREKP